MSSNITSEDLRSIKTKKALYAALFTLLRKHNFKKITIKGICEEALISRAAFYAHFIDKYDLLEHSLAKLLPGNFNNDDSYEQIEIDFNRRIHENILILGNLINDADEETLGILFDFILSAGNLTIEKNDSKEINPKNIVLSNFYAGGIIFYLLWQLRNNFPAAVPPMNKHLYEIMNTLKNWQAE